MALLVLAQLPAGVWQLLTVHQTLVPASHILTLAPEPRAYSLSAWLFNPWGKGEVESGRRRMEPSVGGGRSPADLPTWIRTKKRRGADQPALLQPFPQSLEQHPRPPLPVPSRAFWLDICSPGLTTSPIALLETSLK